MTDVDDHELAARIATGTGELLERILDGSESDGRAWSSIEYVGDRKAHEFIVEELRCHRPDDAILSEEGRDDLSRLDADRVWIVDPLDGSSDFGWSDHWSVHIALCEEGEPTVGAVAVPGWQTTFRTDPPSERIISRLGARPAVVVSRSRRHVDGRILHEALGADVMAVGSAGVKAMAVVRGDVDAYVHGGGLYEWDSAAPVAVARAAGLEACGIDGAELVFNKRDPWSPGLIICRPHLREPIVDAMRRRRY